MIDVEERVNRVFNPEVRPLVREAHRCYVSGSARGSIILTWTALCADLIAKVQILAEEGESEAKPLVSLIEQAQARNASEAVAQMATVERTLLDTAEKLELIDFTQHRQLERIREDRHLCAHPSIRPLGELYEPTLEYARAHLVAALEAVLVHPPSQGRKVVRSFLDHVADPGFVFEPEFLRHAFFDRVRPSARHKVVEAAAKFAVLTIEDDAIPVKPRTLADRMAKCLRSFAERDADLVKAAVAKQMGRLETAEPTAQLLALGRLGDLPAFWSAVAAPVRTLLNAKIQRIGERLQIGLLKTEEAGALALVAVAEVRAALPALDTTFDQVSAQACAQAIGRRPDPFFTDCLADLLKDAPSFDIGQYIADHAVLPCADYLARSELDAILQAWAENRQCWGRAMPSLLVELYTLTGHLGPDRKSAWEPVLAVAARDNPSAHRTITSAIEAS